jgi:hypothetical protein
MIKITMPFDVDGHGGYGHRQGDQGRQDNTHLFHDLGLLPSEKMNPKFLRAADPAPSQNTHWGEKPDAFRAPDDACRPYSDIQVLLGLMATISSPPFSLNPKH